MDLHERRLASITRSNVIQQRENDLQSVEEQMEALRTKLKESQDQVALQRAKNNKATKKLITTEKKLDKDLTLTKDRVAWGKIKVGQLKQSISEQEQLTKSLHEDIIRYQREKEELLNESNTLRQRTILQVSTLHQMYKQHNIQPLKKYEDIPLDKPLDIEFVGKWVDSKKESDISDKRTPPETSLIKDRFQRAPLIPNDDDKMTYIREPTGQQSNCQVF